MPPQVRTDAGLTQPGSKISSIRISNNRARSNASGRLGSYRPVSIAFTVCRDTPNFSASTA